MKNYTRKEITTYETCYYNDNSELHRTDGAAREFYDGEKYYFINGQIHRTKGPAIELICGETQYYKHDLLHRFNAPAIISKRVIKYYEYGRQIKLY